MVTDDGPFDAWTLDYAPENFDDNYNPQKDRSMTTNPNTSTTIDGDPFRDDDSGVTYVPYIDMQFGTVGYMAEHPDGRVEYIYLNASGGSDDGIATVFVYVDTDLSSFANAEAHFVMFDDGASDA